MRYTLRQIEVFLATALAENISRAAEQLAMSQSAASGALKELERQFGVELFDRVGKRLRLNELGRSLLPRVQNLLDQARELEQALARHADTAQLKVGATLTIGNYLAVDLMARYMVASPGCRVQLEVGNMAQIADALLHFRLDVGMVEGELQHPDLEIRPWRSDRLQVVCAPDHPLATHGPLTDEDLLAARWIVRETGSGTRQTFERAMWGLLPRLQVVLELQHTEAILRAVRAGLGLGCLSGVALADALARGLVVPLQVPQRDFSRHFYFVLHRARYHSRAVEQWLALCRQDGDGD